LGFGFGGWFLAGAARSGPVCDHNRVGREVYWFGGCGTLATTTNREPKNFFFLFTRGWDGVHRPPGTKRLLCSPPGGRFSILTKKEFGAFLASRPWLFKAGLLLRGSSGSETYLQTLCGKRFRRRPRRTVFWAKWRDFQQPARDVRFYGTHPRRRGQTVKLHRWDGRGLVSPQRGQTSTTYAQPGSSERQEHRGGERPPGSFAGQGRSASTTRRTNFHGGTATPSRVRWGQPPVNRSWGRVFTGSGFSAG